MRSLVGTSHRRLRLASFTVLVGVAALGGVAAWNPVTTAESVDSVSFTGGCGLLGSGLGAESSPDTSRLRVPAGSQVEFANRLDRPAELRLDGKPAAEVPAGGTEEVTFFEGPVTAEMLVDCPLGKPSGSVTVEVFPDAAAPAPRQAPGNRTPSAPSNDPSGAKAPANGGDSGGRADGDQPSPGSGSSHSPMPVSGQPGSSSGRGTQGPGNPGGEPAPVSPDHSASHGDLAPGRPVPSGPGGSELGPTGAESAGGWWPGSPSGSGSSGPNGAAPDAGPNSAGSTPSGRPDTDKTPGTAPDATEPDQAADQVEVDQITHAADASTPGGSIGLLALIATVCVVGASAGAVRAILTHRSNRAEWA